MDLLNQSFTQVSDLFRSMTTGARITTGLLLVLVVISMGFLFSSQGPGPTIDLMNGVAVPADNIPVMLAAFDKADLPSPDIRGTQLMVSQDKQNAYMAALVDADALPPNIDMVFEQMFEKQSPLGSFAQREQRLKFTIQRYLGMLIRSIPDIQSAQVSYDIDNKGAFRRTKVATASVIVTPKGNQHLDDTLVRAIRNLVAPAVGGLDPEGVSVFDTSSKRTWAGNLKDAGLVENNPYARVKQNYEQQYKSKILSALEFLPSLTVETDVVLSPEQESLVRKLEAESKTIAVRTSESTNNITSTSGGPAGRPGYQPNSPQASANQSMSVGGSGAMTSMVDKSGESESEYLVPGTETRTTLAGLIPQRVSASIGVPESYFIDIWRQRNPTAEGEEPKKPDDAALTQIRTAQLAVIQSHVLGVLPPVDGLADPKELVTVTPFADLPEIVIPEPEMSENALVWLGQYWSTLGMIGLALISLKMLRTMIKSAPISAAPPSDAVTVKIGKGEPKDAEEEIADRLGRFSGSGRSLRDEVSDLVNEDPEAAANILKTWIGAAT